MPVKKQIYTAIIGIFIVIAGISYSFSKIAKAPKEAELFTYFSEESAEEALEEAKNSEIFESSKEAMIFVHVCGEVANPGVYQVTEGARGYEVIEQAGGFTESAAKDYLNLAQTVRDGDKLTVPNVNDLEKPLGEEPTAEGTTNALVNLNTADAAQLMTLPGIGEAKAAAIIKYREKSGGFSAIEEIMNISGIKEAAFAKIEEYITVK